MTESYTARWRVSASGFLPRLLDHSRARRAVTILMYHAVARSRPLVPDWCLLPEPAFVRQMQYVKAHFEVLPLSDAVTRLHDDSITRPTAVITFDDGFQNIHDVAFPVLRRLALPATVFLNTGFVGSDETIWFCRVVRAMTHTDRKTLLWQGRRYSLQDASARRSASVRIQERLKQLRPDDLVGELEQIETRLGRSSGGSAAGDEHWRVLDPASIRRMAASGLIEFGAHTDTHAILTRVGPDRARREIERSIRMTSDLTGRPCDLFAYPNGTVHDYDAGTTALLRDLGIRAAVTTIPGLNTTKTPPLELHRDGIGGDHRLLTFQANIHHARQHLRVVRETSQPSPAGPD
jgi:peptidoglycan/xylan/chitin deacetylase (PgdA/CDA1 family)